ncbi:hypothetical protein [Dactylosporangium sp. CA-092794]|uniref:hypothetical protein n=1 Tax=Dactylosporangium sp. CA-092794 TaxID=3239929 RepID=UPI003D8A8B6A
MTEVAAKEDRLSVRAAQVAARDGLGERRAWQAEREIGANIFSAVAGLVMAAVLVGVGVLIFRAGSAVHIGGYHVLLLGLMAIGAVVFVGGVFVVGLSLRLAFAGAASTYLYDGGIVAVAGRRVDVIPWARIERLVVATSRSGKPTRFIVVGAGGGEVRINPKPLGRGDDVAGLVVSAVRQLGRPIVDGGPDADGEI